MTVQEIQELNVDNYKCPKGEENSYHVVQEVKQFDPKTGQRISTPRVQKYGRKMFESLIYDNLLKQGYEIRILHNPKDWEKQKRAEAEAKAKANAEAKAQAEKEKFDAAVAAAVEKALAAKKEPKEPKTRKVKSSL